MREKQRGSIAALLTLFSLPSLAGVYVSAPGTATVSTSGSANSASPVHFVATGTSPACSKGVASMRIYTAANVLAYSVQGSSLDTSLSLSAGTYNVTVQESDYCGWAARAMLRI